MVTVCRGGSIHARGSDRAIGVGRRGTLLTGIAGLLILVGIEVRLWSKGRHQVPFLQVSTGTLWLIVWAFVDGTRLVLDQPTVPFSGWTAAVVLAGVGQLLAGSLAYLIPVLIGAPLASDVNRMTHRPLIPLSRPT